jgi:tetratricopeptide (TPR) repeat protein
VSPPSVRARDFQSFKDSLEEYASDGRTPERLANALMALTASEIEDAFRQAPVLDYRLTDREKAGLYKMMLGQAMAEFTEGQGESPSASDLPLSHYFGGLREMPVHADEEEYRLIRTEDPLEESARLYKLSKEKADAIESLTLQGGGTGSRTEQVNLLDPEGRLSTVPGEYFYRESPYLEIAAAGSSLFYVIKGFPALPAARTGQDPDPAGPGSDLEDRAMGIPPERPSPTFKVILMTEGIPRDRPAAASAVKPALILTEEETEGVLDRLMALPVVEQVKAFHRDYLEAYDPESPVLARLTGDFLYRNLGMVFVQTGDPLSRGFDLLEEVFYDNLSLDALVPYSLRHARSKTGAEILLGLAATYEFERRAIVALDGALDAAKSVLTEPANERFHAHNKNVKAYVIREVYRDLAAELRDLGYPALETVIQKYRDEQLRVYDLLIEMGGEIKCRALYSLGRLYWDEGRTEQAMETWKSADPAFADGILSQITGAIVEDRKLGNPVARIDTIFGRLAAGERSDQLARIAKFHKWDRR